MVKILFVGCGGVGGYFGARLLASGLDVAFSVTENSRADIEQKGLTVLSPKGDIKFDSIETLSNTSKAVFDYIFIAVKTIHLNNIIEILDKHSNSNTRFIPLLNGVNAQQNLVEKGINKTQIYGGLAKIISFKQSTGVIKHVGSEPHITLGLFTDVDYENDEENRIEHLLSILKGALLSAGLSKDIEQALWRKFLFVASWGALASAVELSIGEIREADTFSDLILLLKEYQSIANIKREIIDESVVEQTLMFMKQLPAQSTTSMQRDIANGLPSEFDALVEFPLSLAVVNNIDTPILAECACIIRSKCN